MGWGLRQPQVPSRSGAKVPVGEVVTDRTRIVVAQMNFLVGDIRGNVAKMTECVREVAHEGVTLVVFPELSVTGYPPEDLLLRADFIAESEYALARLARRAAVSGVGLIVGAPRRTDGKMFNSAFYLADGKVLAHYDKMVLPNYSVFDEKRYFSVGSEARVIRVGGMRVGLTVCEDIWVSGGPALRAKQAGAELLINLNASPFHLGKDEQRSAVLRARAEETGLPIVYVNQVGGQDELVFDGDSRVIAADGTVLWSARLFDEDVRSFEWKDGRVESAYPPRAEVPRVEILWRALVTGLRDYAGKNGLDGAVIGLSGGVDSAVTLVLAAKTLGAARVRAVAMPSRYTADMSLEDARSLAENLGVALHEISIEPVFQAMERQLEGVFTGAPPDVTEENIQARVRGNLLMAIANKYRLAVISTGNKSEMAVGYATLYGDMAGAYAPLKDVVKTRVYELAEWCNRVHEVIPRRVIRRSPSAELAPGQVDQDRLPPYQALDAIIEEFIESDASYEDMVARGFSGDTVLEVQAMVLGNEYKRRQAPPGTRVTEKAFGKDRRYPVTSGFRLRRGRDEDDPGEV